MPTYSIDTDNNLAVHPDKDAAMKAAGATGAAFATEAQLGAATALWPGSRLLEVWNNVAGAPPFAELKEVKRFTDRKSAVTRIWAAAQCLGETLEEAMKIAEQDMLRAQQEMMSGAKAARRAKVKNTAAPNAPARPKATKDATSSDEAPAHKQREGTRKATVLALLERDGGATLEEIMAATLWQNAPSAASSPHSAASTATRSLASAGRASRLESTKSLSSAHFEIGESPASVPASPYSASQPSGRVRWWFPVR
jgi:hypothetical protein